MSIEGQERCRLWPLQSYHPPSFVVVALFFILIWWRGQDITLLHAFYWAHGSRMLDLSYLVDSYWALFHFGSGPRFIQNLFLKPYPLTEWVHSNSQDPFLEKLIMSRIISCGVGSKMKGKVIGSLKVIWVRHKH